MSSAVSKKRLVIRGAAADIVIDDHRDNGMRNVVSAYVPDVEGGDKDVLGQHAGPLVLTRLHLNSQSAAASLCKARRSRSPVAGSRNG